MSPQLLNDAFYRVDFDRELVFKFFLSFSLFEYALKQTGFIIVNQGGDVKPDWGSFARTIDGQFNAQANPELSTAVSYFLNHPTKKQNSRNNQLTFVRSPRPQNISDTEWLSILIRRVRNNLFHGSKFSYDRHRDTLLIQFSLLILDDWINHNADVRRAILSVR